MIRVDILTLAGASAVSHSATIDVLSAVNEVAGRPVFDVRVLSPHAPELSLRGGMVVHTQALAGKQARDLVIVPGLGEAYPAQLATRMTEPDVAEAASWLAQAWQQGTLIAASCSSVFVLGQAGLLDQRRCTTTWWLAPVLQGMAPGCDLTVDAMVTEHDRVWTAGAAFAQVDLMLALVARLAGPTLAAEVSRYLLVDARPSQAAYIAPVFLAAQDPLASRMEALVRTHLPAPPALGEMASQLGVSPRTLTRRIAQATGMPPMRFVQKIRLETAVHLLQTTRLAIEQVAVRVGFEDASALYRLMRRQTGLSPSAFRSPGGQ